MSVNKIILNGQEIELSDEQARRIIGSGTLGTVAQTLIGGVNELDTKVGSGILTTDNKALIGGVNEINEKIQTVNGNITNIQNDITQINQNISNIGSSSGEIFYTPISASTGSGITINSGEIGYASVTINNYEGYKLFGLLSYGTHAGTICSVEIFPSQMKFTLGIYNNTNSTITPYLTYAPILIKDGVCKNLT